MLLNDKDIETLEAYWKDQLSDEEAEKLADRLNHDADFRKDAKEWKETIQIGFAPSKWELKKREELSEKLKQLDAKYKKEEEKKGSIRSLLYISVAAVIALLVVTYIFWPDSNTYFEHLDRDNLTLADNRTPGEIAYDNKDYQKAWSLLEMEIKQPNDSLNLLYAGVAALGAGEEEEAIRMLKALKSSPEWTSYTDEMDWYLAIAYLDIGQVDSAIYWLEGLKEAESSLQEKAEILLIKLKE